MLRPNSKGPEHKSKIFELISLMAKYPSRFEGDERYDNFLKESSIYQYELPDLPYGRITLSEDVYYKLKEFASLSNKNEANLSEFGGYLFGQEKGANNIYFSAYNMVKSDVHVREFNTTPEMENEVKMIMKLNNVNCFCHVHTHPNSESCYSGTPSNQDLYLYAWFQEQYAKPGKYFMGALITPSDDNRFNDICFIFYDKTCRTFFKINDIYVHWKDGKIDKLPKEEVINPKTKKIEKRSIIKIRDNK